jgi:glucose-6-phosphate 1-dehydrogenase
VADLLKTLVVLGARGDMTGRLLLPALVRLAASGGLPDGLEVLAVDRDAGDDEDYRSHARAKLDAHLPGGDEEKAADALLERLSYRRADVTSAEDLRAALAGIAAPMGVYLALPNVLFRPTLQALADAGLPPDSTVVVEKPFGTDLADAKALNELIARSFDEHHVFRIDHFLAKQTVLDILGLRFANRIFDPVWNSNHVARVDITWYESLGLEGRASYYDRAGALRDMIQNHLLQMLALIAMEPPRTMTERDLRDHKVEVLRATQPPPPEKMRAATRRARYSAGTAAGRQLPAYADEDGVDPDRGTETFAEVTFRISNWRWAGTPFRLRTGKAINKERREIAVHFKSVPHEPFDDRDRPNVLRFRLSPDAISLGLNLNAEGDPFDLEQVSLDAEFPTQDLPPYSLLLKEILEGDPTLSIRGDEAEEMWRIVEPVLAAWADDAVPLEEYRAGSAGPSGPHPGV